MKYITRQYSTIEHSLKKYAQIIITFKKQKAISHKLVRSLELAVVLMMGYPGRMQKRRYWRYSDFEYFVIQIELPKFMKFEDSSTINS